MFREAGAYSALMPHMEDIIGVPMSEKVQECVDVSRLTPYERVRRRTAEHGVDALVSQILEVIVVVVSFTVERPRSFAAVH